MFLINKTFINVHYYNKNFELNLAILFETIKRNKIKMIFSSKFTINKYFISQRFKWSDSILLRIPSGLFSFLL